MSTTQRVQRIKAHLDELVALAADGSPRARADVAAAVRDLDERLIVQVKREQCLHQARARRAQAAFGRLRALDRSRIGQTIDEVA